jgi:hypothetical protein
MVTTGAMPVSPFMFCATSRGTGALGWPWRPRAPHCGKQTRRPMSCARLDAQPDLPEGRRTRELGRKPHAQAHQTFLATQ